MKLFYLILFFGLYTVVCRADDAPVQPVCPVTLPELHKGTLEVDTLLLDSYGSLPESRRTFYLTARKILADSRR